ncbi:MAG TPA: hydantoinase/oxoprolinase family protein [Ktedonobacteraceae bacterium]|jgi:N-methylhydantoinase A|nr:hydantoinase/oxoprolinase family protein [Ktedonobacteraceae bacterium]
MGGIAGHHRVGVDIGGTFTDLVIFDDASGNFAVGKTLTTPRDPSQAVEMLILDTLEREQLPIESVRQIIHGTTLVTNAIIERTGSPTALFATRGFRDSTEIGREHRYELYDLMLEMPQPLVPRYLRFDVPQRTQADGTTLQELDAALVERLTRELVAYGIEAVAIAFLHSFTNPAAEREAQAIIQRIAPNMRVSISSEVVPEIREFERTSTTVANVYVQDRVEKYLRQLQARLARLAFKGQIFLMISSGGIVTVDTAIRFPVRLLESGPAAGALAAASYGTTSGYADLLSFDMGGTTAKFCVIDQGQPLTTNNFEVDRRYRLKKGSGLPIKLPVIEMIEIGAGGGSIARIDPLGLLKVGPESAGADPGPACYGLGGTEPTVTDADLVLGYLDPGYFLGGQFKIDLAAARQAIAERIAQPLGLSVEGAAWGIHQVVNENMANAARIHTLERGKDPHRFPVFAFGGAGPVHGFRIAKALGSPAMIAPFGAGVMSAVGFLTAPLAFDFVRSWRARLDALDWQKANTLLDEMEAEGQALLQRSGVAPQQLNHRRQADMRYVGQGHEIVVPLPPGHLNSESVPTILKSFEEVYQRLYERLSPAVPVEIINWRVISSGPTPKIRLQAPGEQQARAQAVHKGSRQAYFPELGGYFETPVYNRYGLLPGMSFSGPAIVEERESTVIVGPDSHFHIDEQRNLIIEL